MDIRWQGRSTFEVTSGAQKILFDPFPGAPKSKVAGEGPIVVTSSHQDAAHIETSPWRKTAKILEGPGEYEISGLALRGIPTPRSDEASARATNTVYVLECENLSVCHLGQLRDTLSSQAQQALGNVDILIIPAGGADTIGPEEAASTIRALDPRVAIPVYNGDQKGAAAEQALARLVAEIGVTASDPQPRLTVSRSNLPAELRVVILRTAE
ncbi:MAG: MBL fold metallo-hydrolase [Chloroflexi bacterium]|nr:MBL fold metallo-hydrolase [Chloroflexota bacterium]